MQSGIKQEGFGLEEFGLVLGGGGAKGAYQVGAWKAICEYGLDAQIKAVSGASIGALNGAMVLSSDVATMEEAWTSVDRLSLLDVDLELIDGVEGACPRSGFLDLVHTYVDKDKLRNKKKPLYVSLSEHKTKQTYYADSLKDPSLYVTRYVDIQACDGDTFDQYLLATTALPAVYEAVTIDGHLYRDGGITDNLPIQPLYDLGYRRMIVVGMTVEQQRAFVQYPDVEFYHIFPYRSLAEVFGNSMNFDPDLIRYAIALGYLDGRNWLAFHTGPETDATFVKQQAAVNYEKAHTYANQQKLQADVERDFGKITDIMNRYGIT